jgi:hypothetical protein
MNDGNRVLGWPRRVLPLALRVAVAITASAGLAMLAAACGGSPSSHVAQRGSTATQSSSSPNGSGAAANAGGSKHAEALGYSQCMRSHGITDFPDPTASGDFAIHSAGPNSDLDRNNPAFQTAEQACQRFSPQHDVTPAQHTQLENEYLSFARCMRSHGIRDFPDPVTGSGGHPGFRLQGGSSSDLNSNAPTFQRGVEACQRILGHRFRFVFTPSGVGKGA